MGFVGTQQGVAGLTPRPFTLEEETGSHHGYGHIHRTRMLLCEAVYAVYAVYAISSLDTEGSLRHRTAARQVNRGLARYQTTLDPARAPTEV